ncbi:MAG: hypothetical protein ACREX4_22770 [Gammaproteobacteria bacterium]
MNQIFKIFADGSQVGISVAPSNEVALEFAKKALTRRTASKEDSGPDYQDISAIPMESGNQVTPSFVSKLLARISTAANSRFADV